MSLTDYQTAFLKAIAKVESNSDVDKSLISLARVKAACAESGYQLTFNDIIAVWKSLVTDGYMYGGTKSTGLFEKMMIGGLTDKGRQATQVIPTANETRSNSTATFKTGIKPQPQFKTGVRAVAPVRTTPPRPKLAVEIGQADQELFFLVAFEQSRNGRFNGDAVGAEIGWDQKKSHNVMFRLAKKGAFHSQTGMDANFTDPAYQQAKDMMGQGRGISPKTWTLRQRQIIEAAYDAHGAIFRSFDPTQFGDESIWAEVNRLIYRNIFRQDGAQYYFTEAAYSTVEKEVQHRPVAMLMQSLAPYMPEEHPMPKEAPKAPPSSSLVIQHQGFDLFQLAKEAAKYHPIVAFAIAAVGFVACAAITFLIFAGSFRTALIAVVGLLVLSVLIFYFSTIVAEHRRKKLETPAAVRWTFVGFVLLFFVVALLLTSCTFFDWPKPIDKLFTPKAETAKSLT